MRKLFTIFFIFSLAVSGFSQDAQFTQFYAAPLYMNPGFAGSSEDLRVSFNGRAQWTNLPNPFYTYAASSDYYFSDINSGAGIQLFLDRAGSGALTSSEISAFYTYKLQLGGSLVVRPGLQFSLVSRGIDYSKLTFGDQLDLHGGQPVFTGETFEENRVNYFDFGSGVLVHDKNFWAGFAFHHINKPDQTLNQGESILPVKFNIHGGYKIDLTNPVYSKSYGINRVQSLTPAVHYKMQGLYDQMDVGIYYRYEPLLLGIWYRGIPLMKSYDAGYGNHDAISFLLGFKNDNFSVGYSYDLTISQLGPTGTAGSHEISLSYTFDTNSKYRKKKKKKRKDYVVPCPNF